MPILALHMYILWYTFVHKHVDLVRKATTFSDQLVCYMRVIKYLRPIQCCSQMELVLLSLNFD